VLQAEVESRYSQYQDGMLDVSSLLLIQPCVEMLGPFASSLLDEMTDRYGLIPLRVVLSNSKPSDSSYSSEYAPGRLSALLLSALRFRSTSGPWIFNTRSRAPSTTPGRRSARIELSAGEERGKGVLIKCIFTRRCTGMSD
jgi:hypothetical protein